MSKPFKTIDEQIELLRYRGMTIADDEVARHALETLGYYRLSGYWYSFREHAPEEALGCRSDLFIPGTSFDQVIRLYDFDTQLRVTVFKWPGLVLWTGCFEGCWLLLVVLCPLARVLVG